MAMAVLALALFAFGRHRPFDLCAAGVFGLNAGTIFVRNKRVAVALGVGTMALGATWLALAITA